jgi:hypothetical protein
MFYLLFSILSPKTIPVLIIHCAELYKYHCFSFGLECFPKANVLKCGLWGGTTGRWWNLGGVEPETWACVVSGFFHHMLPT